MGPENVCEFIVILDYGGRHGWVRRMRVNLL